MRSALLLLALELERQGRRDEADAAMRTAVRLAPADPQSLLLVAGYFLRTGEEAQALATLRRAVDSSPAEVGDRVWPVFSAALATGRHREFFDAMARDNPSWWPAFFSYACARAASAGAVQAVFAARVAADVATRRRAALPDRAPAAGRPWTGAYLVWLNGLPLEQRQRVGYVFNGGFELPLSNVGIRLEDPRAGRRRRGGRARRRRHRQARLSVTFSNQRYAGPPVYQYLLLAPGRYRLEGRARSDLNAWLGLQWGLYCQDGAGRETKQLAHSEPFAGSTRWREFRRGFRGAGELSGPGAAPRAREPEARGQCARDCGNQVERQGLVRRRSGPNR